MSRRTCFLVGLVVAVFVFPLQAQREKDVRIVSGVATHMGQVASDHVVLHSVSLFPPPSPGVPTATDEFEFKRLFPDGSGDLVNYSAFVVPDDKVLVVTDVSVRNVNSLINGVLIQLSIDDLFNPPVYELVLQIHPFGKGGNNDGMASGFIVAPGQQILALQTFLPPADSPGQTTIILRGYLAPNQ